MPVLNATETSLETDFIGGEEEQVQLESELAICRERLSLKSHEKVGLASFDEGAASLVGVYLMFCKMPIVVK